MDCSCYYCYSMIVLYCYYVLFELQKLLLLFYKTALFLNLITENTSKAAEMAIVIPAEPTS